jgi:hypothetical protein
MGHCLVSGSYLAQIRERGLWRQGKTKNHMLGHSTQSPVQSRATAAIILGCDFGKTIPKPKSLTRKEIIMRNKHDEIFCAQDARRLEQMRQTARVFGDFNRIPRLGV